MEAIGIILLIVGAVFALVLAVVVLIYGVKGAMLQFIWASEFGFVGVVVFFAAWVFMFPIMAIWAVLWGRSAS